MVGAGLALLVLTVLGLLWPYTVIAPLAILGGRIGVTLLIKAYKLWSNVGSAEEDAKSKVPRERQDRANDTKNLMSIYDKESWSIGVQGARGDGAVCYEAGGEQRITFAAVMTSPIWPTQKYTAKIVIFGLA
jgi:hypothetical protein